MERVLLFFLGFLASLILTVLFYDSYLIDPLVSLLFFSSSLIFIFAREELPKKGLNIPSIHYYQKSRLNNYGYVMAFSLIISSILYVTLTLNFSAKPALVSLILWFFVFLTSVFMTLFFARNLFRDIVVDYIIQSYPEGLNKKERNSLEFVVTHLLREPKLGHEKKKIVLGKIMRKTKINEELASGFIDKFYEYMKGTTEKVASDEISEINK